MSSKTPFCSALSPKVHKPEFSVAMHDPVLEGPGVDLAPRQDHHAPPIHGVALELAFVVLAARATQHHQPVHRVVQKVPGKERGKKDPRR